MMIVGKWTLRSKCHYISFQNVYSKLSFDKPWQFCSSIHARSKPGVHPNVHKFDHILMIPMIILTFNNFNTLSPRQNSRHFADDIFRYIFLNDNVRILFKISLKFVPKGLIDNNPALVQIMAWRCPGDKPLSEPMMVNFPTHICLTRPQWVNKITINSNIYDKRPFSPFRRLGTLLQYHIRYMNIHLWPFNAQIAWLLLS